MKYMSPSEIEKRSMEIIGSELELRGITPAPETAPVLKRVIHTTADFDYVENLFFTQDSVRAALSALRRGVTVVTDTNMALSGISKPGLAKLGCSAVCYMADPDVAREAKERNTTRAVVSMERAAALPDTECIYAIGNAPTALMKIAELIEKGLRPALVIGVPVGFVNVAEAKEEAIRVCLEYGVPCIAARGRKGGSNVAAAIVNALVYMAVQS